MRHERDELLVADLHEDVARRDPHALTVLPLGARADDLAEGFLFHSGEERLDDAELDVGLEQRQPHFTQRSVDVLLGQLGEAGETIACGFEPLGQGIEHG